MIKKIFYYLKIYGVVKFLWYIIREAQFSIKTVLQNTYTPFGDDIIIDNLLGRKKRGFYIDIGAYDPTRFSNTKRFYLRGWRGINVEPNPKRIGLFNKYRPRDVNLNIGIASKNGSLNFFRFEPESLSTFSNKVAKDYQKLGFKLPEFWFVYPVHSRRNLIPFDDPLTIIIKDDLDETVAKIGRAHV